MQIFYLSTKWMLFLIFILWPFFQLLSALLCLKIPDQYLSVKGFFYKEHGWEKKGKFYEKVFRIRKWKHFLPDGGAVTRGGYKKKHLMDYSVENLERFLIESCRAEFSHFLAILPFWIFGFFTPSIVVWCMFIYAVVINLPCIIAQRYNRPRILRILEIERKKKLRGENFDDSEPMVCNSSI